MNRQVSGGVFQTVAWNFTVCKIRSSIIVSSFRDMLVAGIDVRSLRGVVADRSAHRWNQSFWFLIRITTSFQVRTWIVDTLIAHTQETLRITDLDTFGDVRSTRRNKTVCCIFFVRAPICARRSREPSERGEDGNTNEVNDLHSFRGHAANAASSCSRAAVQQTSGDWLSTREIKRWRFCTSCCHRSRSPSFVHTHLQTKSRDTTGINHLRCRVCCARRLVTSQALI